MAWEQWEDPRSVLKRYGIHASRRHSQNFLVARGVVEAIADAVGTPESVVEIGPGLGTLTSELLRRGISITAIEKDPRMIEILASELAGAPAEVVAGDAARLDLSALVNAPTVVVGNLPYAITGAILRRLVDQRQWITRVVIMVQKEVRDRLLASPGTKSYGVPTVFIRNVFEAQSVRLVSPGSFHPPPKVRSAVVSLVPRTAPLVEPDAMFDATVKAVFGQRRKTLRNALRAAFPAEVVETVLGDRDPKVRGETFDVAEFGELASALRKHLGDRSDDDAGE